MALGFVFFGSGSLGGPPPFAGRLLIALQGAAFFPFQREVLRKVLFLFVLFILLVEVEVGPGLKPEQLLVALFEVTRLLH